jgi:DNA repair exonuclease SbcCD nuclease subunit
MDEFGERVLPKEALERLKQFDYVALGHWHKFNHIKKYGNVFYSGSTERFSFSEIGYDKGIIEVTIDKKETRTEFIKIPTRNFYHFKVDNCSQKSKSQIVNEIVEQAKKENIAESIIHLSLYNLSSVQLFEITKDDLIEIFDAAIHFTYSKNTEGKSEELLFESESFDLKEQLNNELSKMFTDKDELKQVREITNEILMQIEDEEIDADN